MVVTAADLPQRRAVVHKVAGITPEATAVCRPVAGVTAAHPQVAAIALVATTAVCRAVVEITAARRPVAGITAVHPQVAVTDLAVGRHPADEARHQGADTLSQDIATTE